MAKRITQEKIHIEYVNKHKSRITQIKIMVEYGPPPPHVRKYGPAIQ